VIDGETVCSFNEQTSEAIVNAVDEFEQCRSKFKRNRIRENADRLAPADFVLSFANLFFNNGKLTAGRCGRKDELL
jgi:hypothetical protein